MASGAKRAGVLVACAMGALASLLGDAEAQPAQRTLTQVERDRRAENTRAERLRNQANAARREVAALDQRLVESGRRRSDAEAAATAAEERLSALREQMQSDGVRYQHQRDAFEAAIISAAFAQRRMEYSAVRANVFARAVAPTLQQQQHRTAQSLAEARLLDRQIAEEQSVLADAQAAIDAEVGELITLLARRRAVQTALNDDATAAERRVQRLAAEARSLRELAERVQRASTRPRTGSTQGPSVIPAAWLAPAEGRVARNFGTRTGGGPPAQGATLRTRARAQVVSPAAGEVAYSGTFRSYGQVLILNLDGGYALVLTGLENIQARTGEHVVAGQPIGEMSSSDTPAPELYVEVRRNGQPVDPARWLNARGLAADSGLGRNG